jgi:hypothetical protein
VKQTINEDSMSAKSNKAAWFDENSNTPIIAEQAQKLESFLSVMADGRIDGNELKQQEDRLVKLMREIEPQLSDDLHGKVTQLLCELTAYDLMKVMHSVYEARPKTVFRG